MDIQVGGGITKGYPAGRIINIVGDKSSGKTFFSCEIIAASYYKYKDKLKWVYDDCESGFSFDTKKLYGVEIMPLDHKKRIKSKTVEEAYGNIRLFLESIKEDELGIYVIDSLDSLNDKEGEKIAEDQYTKFKKKKLSPQEKEEKEKGSYRMAKPKYLSNTFFPSLSSLIEKKNCLLIIISQVRYNLDPMSFEKYTRAGGKAMDFYAHTVLWLASVEDIIKKGIPIGAVTKAKNNKSKTPRPRRSVFIKLLFDYGIDNIQSNIDYIYDLLTPRGKLGKNVSIEWDNEKYTRAKLIEYIENSNLQKELKKRMVQKWEIIEESVKTNRPPKYQ
jgi:RecA/RadA recombinase